ncbi:MAG TPA: adenylate/guanylate cyclase domain-containing protein [Spirochaetota bacterium]|nr:adenylate/guanylate cyclase domain-containing protein [Spirochaetota bacterium]
MSLQSGLITNLYSYFRGRLLPLCLFIAVIIFSVLGAWEGIDRNFSDFLMRIRIENYPLPMSPRIIPVDLNDSAERNLGDRVDNRQAFVDLFTVLGEGQLSGGMDFLFKGKKVDSIDKAMAAAEHKMNSLVLAVVPIPADLTKFSGKDLSPEEKQVLRSNLWHPGINEPGTIPVAVTFLMPSYELAAGASYLGHITVTQDSDGLYRRVPMLYRWEDGYIPSLPLALAAAELKIDTHQVEVRAGSEIVLKRKNGDAIHIPIDSSGAAWIPYPSTWTAGWKRIPLDKVTAVVGNADEMSELIDQWTDGIVIAADITTSHKDFGSTPLETVYPLSGIHTSILNGILTGIFFRSAGMLYKGCIILFLLISISVACGLKRGTWFHWSFALLLLIITSAICALWFIQLILPWFAAPVLGLAAAWTGSFFQRVLKNHEEKLLLKNALSRYFPRALAQRIMSEKRTDLRPASRELTILFSDIAGFTKWSSDKSPETVHEFLSDYLESMAAIIFEYGGTVDKFMGDGILAFFGDPWEQPDHTSRCLNAALAMQDKVRELKTKWAPIAGIDLKIRIGVNTGKVIVGNLGSKTRIEYTVIGAAVNLAQRMESNAPVGGILVASDAWLKTGTAFRYGEMQRVTVKGYEVPIEAYVLEGMIEG